MKKSVLGLVVVSMVFSGVVFAQSAATDLPAVAQPAAMEAQSPAKLEWAALMKKQMEERRTLNDQLKAERDLFLQNHPDLAAFVEEETKAAQARRKQRLQDRP
ncbi:MAG: hypothetical protein HQL17_03735 [Candidatus Omnitrophica bacterium]|nr:hypothetical protein [Candidatus Omnitrophota bacterium]